MINKLLEIQEVTQLIESDKNLILAGDESVLSQLPSGNWIGGSTPYFMGENGGEINQKQVFVTLLPDYVQKATIVKYDANSIETIYDNAPENGFSFIILPWGCKTYHTFALNSPNFNNFATKPVIGWVSGMLFNEISQKTAKVYNGKDLEVLEDSAIVFNIELPEDKIAYIQIVNGFSQGDGDLLKFEDSSFEVENVYIGGKKTNFAKYIIDNKIDITLPLVADIYGASFNVNIREINQKNNTVSFYSPVFSGLDYKIAFPIDNYIKSFVANLPEIDEEDEILFSCNCLLNYSFAKLEGKKVADYRGPVTFGEIAYQLLNRTFVFITIRDVSSV